jgi:hypothetical protein
MLTIVGSGYFARARQPPARQWHSLSVEALPGSPGRAVSLRVRVKESERDYLRGFVPVYYEIPELGYKFEFPVEKPAINGVIEEVAKLDREESIDGKVFRLYGHYRDTKELKVFSEGRLSYGK